MDNVIGCLKAVEELARAQFQLVPGQITHSLGQLQAAFQANVAGVTVRLEQAVDNIKLGKGPPVDDRRVDIVTEGIINGLKTRINTEIKSGLRLDEALNLGQLKKDAAIALDQATTDGIQKFRNEWKFTNIDFTADSKQQIKEQMLELKREMRASGLSTEDISKAFESFNFVDKAGNVLKAKLAGRGVEIFEPAMEVLSEKLGQAATKEVSGSPDFSPAMKIVLGPTGKLAEAATTAAQGTNLTAAGETLEKKIETSVQGAMNEAGNKVSLASAKALAGKIGEGVTSLGNIMTSIPLLSKQVSDLAETWDKPNKSTQDYMDLVGKMGGVLTQGVQTIQALSGVLQIASAAQAVFNAVAALNPYVLIAIAVIALIAGIALLIIYWDKVKAALRDNPWLAVAASLFGIIGIIVVIIAYWDEIKLATLQAANFVSIQIQKIGHFFVGLKNLAGMVWDWIVAQVENAGIGIVNIFITIGVKVQNFFIDLINGVLSLYNKLADSVIGDVLGLSKADLIPPVQLESKLIPPKEVPKVDVEAAFKTGEIKGGLEDQIAKQQKVVDEANKKDEERRQKEREDKAKAAAAPPAAPPGALAPPAFGVPPGAAPAGDLGRPALPHGAVPAAAGPVDSSLHIGAITINLNAEKLEADSAKLLTDELVRQLEAKLEVLARQRDFRTGNRPAAA
jgi:hypothetical protein